MTQAHDSTDLTPHAHGRKATRFERRFDLLFVVQRFDWTTSVALPLLPRVALWAWRQSWIWPRRGPLA